MSIERVTITPDTAKSLLAMNTNNRPVSLSHVKRLATAMRNGEWKFNGDAIRISDTGVLLDGQHRLLAVIDANVVVETLLVKDLPEATFNVIDTNARKRSNADVMAISGEKNTNVLAAALAVLYAYELDDDLVAHRRPSAIELKNVLARHPNIREFTNRSYSFYRLTGQATGCALNYLFTLVDKTKGELFMNRLSTGVGLEQGNPILQLRAALVMNMTARDKFSKRTIAALVIKAFNLWMSDKTTQRLKFQNEERFPEIKAMPAATLQAIRGLSPMSDHL